jgi:hypothetical protein
MMSLNELYKAVPEKITIIMLVNKFPIICVIQRYITIFTRDIPLSL